MFAWKLKRQWDFRNWCWSLHKFSGPNTTYVVKKYEKLQSKTLDMGVSARVGTGKWMWNSGRAPLPMSSQFTCSKIECMSINGHNMRLGLCDVPLIHVFCAQPLWLKWIQREFIFSELHSHWPSSPAVKLIAWVSMSTMWDQFPSADELSFIISYRIVCDVPLVHDVCAQPLWQKWIQVGFTFSGQIHISSILSTQAFDFLTFQKPTMKHQEHSESLTTIYVALNLKFMNIYNGVLTLVFCF